jgi:hypothetical protein
MSSLHRVRLALAIGLLLAACSPAQEAAAPAASAAAPVEAPAAEPAETVDPAPTTDAPAVGELAAVKNDPAVINFEGFGPAKFGASEEDVRMAWGRPLEAGTPAEGASCYQLRMEPMPGNGKGIVFMLEDAKFVRYDVDVPLHVAPGDLTTGMTAAQVEAAFPGRVESQPHKYVEGARYLVVSPEAGGEARLVFETDAAGTLVSWRIGVPPQIHYVEGCG